MAPDQVQVTTVDDVVADLAAECAASARSYLTTVREMATGDNAAAAIQMGLLALSQETAPSESRDIMRSQRTRELRTHSPLARWLTSDTSAT